MLWSLFQPPERNRSHYLFLLACISTSSFYSTQASRPSVLSLKKTSFRHSIFSVYSRSSIGRPSISSRLLSTLCVYPISSCLKLSVEIAPFLTMCLTPYFLPETIKGNVLAICVCYINLCSSISRVPKAHIAAFFWNWLVFCSICPISQPFRHRFLYYLLHFHNPSQS